MKTTTTMTAAEPPRNRRPANLLERPLTARSLLASTSRGMLSFLARLSGRRRRWQRHVRGGGSSPQMPGAQSAAGQQQQPSSRTSHAELLLLPTTSSSSSSSSMEEEQEEEEEEEECARCRSHSCCSCDILGLRRDERDEDEAEEEETRRPGGHCRESRYRKTTTTQQQQQQRRSNDALLRRRRPPEVARGCRTSYIAATLLILSTSLITVAEACSSRSTPKPRPPTPTPRPNITFHMYTCPPDYAEWYCLNGATCFTVKIVDSLLYNCLCANGYIGQRCEFKDLEGSYIPKRHRVMLETASIAGAVTIAVFLAVITFISVYIHCKRKQKELRMMSNGNGVDVVDGPPRDPELRPFCSRSRSLMIFMAKNPNGAATPSIEHTRMPFNWNCPSPAALEVTTRMANVNESKRPSQ